MTKTTTKTETKTEAQAPVKKGWRIKRYYIDLKVFNDKDVQANLSKAPNQVQIMMKHFAESFGDEGKADQGRVLCQSAIDKAGLKTVIEPHVLFAYYRKRMEEYGLRLKDA